MRCPAAQGWKSGPARHNWTLSSQSDEAGAEAEAAHCWDLGGNLSHSAVKPAALTLLSLLAVISVFHSPVTS